MHEPYVKPFPDIPTKRPHEQFEVCLCSPIYITLTILTVEVCPINQTSLAYSLPQEFLNHVTQVAELLGALCVNSHDPIFQPPP